MATVLIEAPFDTKSGYGHRSKDFITAMMNVYPDFDYKLVPINWGNTPNGLLTEKDDLKLIRNIINPNTIRTKPDIHIQITVPNECRPLGHYNVLVTAGIETNAVSHKWLHGANKMDLILVSSEHGKNGFIQTKYTQHDKNGNPSGELKLDTAIDTLFEGYKSTYKKLPKNKKYSPRITDMFDKISTDFNFLFVGGWLNGEIGEDRKDVGMMIHSFLHEFKSTKIENNVGLILKTYRSNNSMIDLKEIETKINAVKTVVENEDKRNGLIDIIYPKIHLVHSDLTDVEMNEMYNHPKVKSYVSFSKGEGFGRPTLEFAASGKPMLASNWSGHLDFLNTQGTVLLDGKLQNVDKSAVWQDVIIPESQWFQVDYENAKVKMRDVYENYPKHLDRSTRRNKVNKFTFKKMEERIKYLFDKYVPSEITSKEIKISL